MLAFTQINVTVARAAGLAITTSTLGGHRRGETSSYSSYSSSRWSALTGLARVYVVKPLGKTGEVVVTLFLGIKKMVTTGDSLYTTWPNRRGLGRHSRPRWASAASTNLNRTALAFAWQYL